MATQPKRKKKQPGQVIVVPNEEGKMIRIQLSPVFKTGGTIPIKEIRAAVKKVVGDRKKAEAQAANANS